jgi:hypothetical protein
MIQGVDASGALGPKLEQSHPDETKAIHRLKRGRFIA